MAVAGGVTKLRRAVARRAPGTETAGPAAAVAGVDQAITTGGRTTTTTLRRRVAAVEAEALGTTTGEDEGEATTEGALRRGTIGAAEPAVPAWAAGAAAIREAGVAAAAAHGVALEGPTTGRVEHPAGPAAAVAGDRARSRGRQSSAAEAGCRGTSARPSARWGVRAGSAGRPAGTLTVRAAVEAEAQNGSMLTTRTL